VELIPYRRLKVTAGEPALLRWSKYNVQGRNDHDGNPSHLLYNTATGRLISSKGNFDYIQSHYSEPASLRSQDAPLADLGFLVPAYEDELATVRYRVHHTVKRSQHLMILPTGQCNFRCTYCYEDYRKGRMSAETQTSLIKWIQARAAAWDELSISWFGGEPLLGYNIIRDLSNQVLSICGSSGTSFRAHMTTNGYLLSLDSAYELIHLHTNRFQITLDGPEALHNAKRPLAGGKGTYQRIFSNLLSLKNTSLDFEVTVRINFDEDNHDHIGILLGELGRHFGGDRRFHVRFFPVGQWGGANDDSLRPLDLQAAVHSILDNRSLAAECGLQSSAQELFGPVCYAARPNSFVIGPDGSVYKCSVAFDNPLNRIGRLLADGQMELDEEKLALWVSDGVTDNECRDCQLFPRCQGASCPLIRIEGKQRPCPPAAGDFQAYIAELAKEAHR
jgi:uncharacterized protein